MQQAMKPFYLIDEFFYVLGIVEDISFLGKNIVLRNQQVL